MAPRAAGSGKRPRTTDFAGVASHFAEQYGRAGAGAEVSEYERPAQVLKRLVYQHIRVLRKAGHLDQLRAYLLERDGGAPAEESGNPFLVGLRLVTGAGLADVSKQKRSKYAAELLYADQHDVSSRVVTAFIASVGSYELIKARLKAGAHEPWGSSFVSKSLSHDPSTATGRSSEKEAGRSKGRRSSGS